MPSQLSLHYSGETPAPMCTPFYIDTNAFAAESACLKFVNPELVTSRCIGKQTQGDICSCNYNKKIGKKKQKKFFLPINIFLTFFLNFQNLSSLSFQFWTIFNL